MAKKKGKAKPTQEAMTLEKIRHTVQLSSDISGGCLHCNDAVGGAWDMLVTDNINHYITAHGYRLLQIGSQTSHGPDGKPWQSTVAIVGHDDPPPLKPPAKIVIGGLKLPEKPKE